MKVDIGATLQDRRGKYVVEKIEKGVVIFHYLDEPHIRHISELELKLRIHENIQGERRAASERLLATKHVRNPRMSAFIAFLRDHGRIEAYMPEREFDRFRRKYYAITGEWTDENHVAVVQDENKRNLSIRVEFPVRGLPLLPECGLHAYSHDGSVSIASNSFGWELIEAGLRLGSVHLKQTPEDRAAEAEAAIECL